MLLTQGRPCLHWHPLLSPRVDAKCRDPERNWGRRQHRRERGRTGRRSWNSSFASRPGWMVASSRSMTSRRSHRPASGFQAEELGLTLAHGEAVLHEIQKVVVTSQIMTLTVAERICRDCGQLRAIKDARTKRLRSIFGVIKVSSHRLRSCQCRGAAPRRVEWPLARFRHQNLPELRYLIGRWAADLPYRQNREDAVRLSADLRWCHLSHERSQTADGHR